MSSRPTVTLAQARSLPLWRQPVGLLILMAAAMPLAFSTWQALLNNFVIEAAAFDGADIGWLQSVREVPGFLAIGVIALLLVMREQTLAVVALVMLGVAVALTASFPSFGGLLLTTFVSSVGFHYYETVNQSLQLQWLGKDRAPVVLGWILAAGSAASLVAYGAIVVVWRNYDLPFAYAYWVAGGLTAAIAIAAWAIYPRFEAPHPQLRRMVLRRRYWLYYAMQFLGGARRQIFIVFAAFMMVEQFGMKIHEVTALFLINYVANMAIAPFLGRYIQAVGERTAQVVEHAGLTLVFLAYAGIYWFDWGLWTACALYVIDHLFFALSIAQKTYFQKIAAPGDIAPTSAVAFTINHIAAVFLPALLGYVWLTDPASVFVLAAGLALAALGLSLLIPRHPAPGQETIFARGLAPQLAE